jgi:Vacuolar sorting protein 9 (VPS9) domain
VCACDRTGKSDALGADVMFPILVNVLIHAQIPCMYLVLYFLHSYSEFDQQGESAYYTTCLEAAVAFVMRLQATEETLAGKTANC